MSVIRNLRSLRRGFEAAALIISWLILKLKSKCSILESYNDCKKSTKMSSSFRDVKWSCLTEFSFKILRSSYKPFRHNLSSIFTGFCYIAKVKASLIISCWEKGRSEYGSASSYLYVTGSNDIIKHLELTFFSKLITLNILPGANIISPSSKSEYFYRSRIC